MDITTYINFLAGPTEAAQTGDSINFVIFLLLSVALVFSAAMFFVFRSKSIRAIVKKIIGIGLPAIFLILAVPVVFFNQSYAEGSSTSVNAVIDKDNCVAYIENGTIQNTTGKDQELLVASSTAANAGLNIPGLQNANLKIIMGDEEIYDSNPFDDYSANLFMKYILSPGQAVQFSSELTGLDAPTAQALEGSGNSIMLRFKFYDSIEDPYEITHKAEPVADYLYEVEYNSWNIDKCNFLCECMGKTPEYWGPDTREYKNYLRREWGLSEEEVQLVVQIRKYLEETNPYNVLCTSCRKGNFIGRNFDWAYDDLDEYIVRASNNGQHNKSIGVVSSFFPLWMQEAIGIESMLPMLTMDGINEHGVAININVVPPDAFGATTGTNPGHERLCAGVVPRFVLDNAKSAAEAIELLKNRDIFTVFFSEFHFMISDATESYIVETVNNELVVLKQAATSPTAMSNFHVSNSDYYDDYECVYGMTEIGPTFSAHCLGVERYDLAMENIANVNSLDNMVSHMKPIYYVNVNKKWSPKNFWSDKNGQKSVNDPTHVFSYYDEDIWEGDRKATFEANEANYDRVHKREDEIVWRLKSGEDANLVCQTVHASCYDIENRQLAVNVQERNTTFKFNLNKSWRENGAATDLFVNGDNVGLATSCSETGSKWNYDPSTKKLTLNSSGCVYSLSGDSTGITIDGEDVVGYSITIPKMEDAVAKVEVVNSGNTLAKARMGIRAVPKNSNVLVTFTAEEGCTFIETGTDTYTKTIESVDGDIVFGTTPGYDLPTVN